MKPWEKYRISEETSGPWNKYASEPDEAIEPTQQSPTKKKRETVWGLAGKVSLADFVAGQRNILGNIEERPAAAIRGALRNAIGFGEPTYVEGAINPGKVETFQNEALRKYGERLANEVGQQTGILGPEHPIGKALLYGRSLGRGTLESFGGLVSDIATNPSDLLGMIIGSTPVGGGRTLGGVISETPPVQAMQRFMMKPRSLPQISNVLEKVSHGVGRITKHFPSRMNDAWFEQQANLGRTIAENLDDAIGNAYQQAYAPVKNLPVSSSAIDDILLRLGVDDATLQNIDDTLGLVDTVEKARLLQQILKKRIPTSYFKLGGVRGKGGIANPKIVAMDARRAIGEVIFDAVKDKNPDAAANIRALNKLAHDKLYPITEKFEGIFGKSGVPQTEELTATFALKNIGKAAQRQTIRRAPKVVRFLRQYVAGEYEGDLKTLMQETRQLLKNMNKYRGRQMAKSISLLAGSVLGGKYLYGKLGRGGD